MNTPTHAVVNLALLARGRGRPHARAILLGAIAPDLLMVVFWLWSRFGEGLGERAIWSEAYFRPAWQQTFDLAHSLPLAAAGAVLAAAARRPAVASGLASVALHDLGDMPLHREDGHRHFFPLSDWRYISPVSYWDPAYYGAAAAGAEVALLLGGSWMLWRRFDQRRARVALVAVNSVALALYLGFYWH